MTTVQVGCRTRGQGAGLRSRRTLRRARSALQESRRPCCVQHDRDSRWGDRTEEEGNTGVTSPGRLTCHSPQELGEGGTRVGQEEGARGEQQGRGRGLGGRRRRQEDGREGTSLLGAEEAPRGLARGNGHWATCLLTMGTEAAFS